MATLQERRVIKLSANHVFADLHVHTTASDGALSPSELVEKASKTGLSAVGITDHDTITGIAQAVEAAENLEIRVVPGIELSCGWPDKDVSLHVLGLFIDYANVKLISLLNRQRDQRHVRALKMLDLLEKIGIQVKPLREEFESQTEKVLGRPHIARYLVETGVSVDFQEAFEQFLARGKPGYVPKEHLSPESGIAAIQEAGGIAAIAHPGLNKHWEEVWAKVSDFQWDGIEVYYPEHSPQQIEFFKQLAAQRGLLETGGSDFHGEYGKHCNRLGRCGLEMPGFEKLSRFSSDRKKSLLNRGSGIGN